MAAEVRAAVRSWPVPVIVTEGQSEKYDAFAAANFGLAASGTVSVELAVCGVPHVVAYRASALTALSGASGISATTLIVNGTNADNAINYTEGSNSGGQSEPINGDTTGDLAGVQIDLAVTKRRDHGHRQAGKIFTSRRHDR